MEWVDGLMAWIVSLGRWMDKIQMDRWMGSMRVWGGWKEWVSGWWVVGWSGMKWEGMELDGRMGLVYGLLGWVDGMGWDGA